MTLPPALGIETIDDIPVGIFMGDRNEVVLQWNSVLAQMTGVESQYIVGRNLFDTFPNLVESGFQRHYQHIVTTGSSIELHDFHFHDPSFGVHQLYARISANPFRSAADIPERIVFVLTDTTERYHTEQRLRESERRLATLMDNLPGVAYRTLNDEHWRMDFVSKGSLELWGYDGAYLLSNPEENTFANRAHPDDLETVKQQVYEAVAQKKPYEVIFRTRNASGTYKWVWEQGSGIFSDDGRLVAFEGFVTDFTAYKQAEVELRKENERLLASMKERYRFGLIIGKSRPMQEVYELILKAAESDVNVAIYGESGTGKELVARAIHDMSDRREGPFVPVNCGAIPETLLEREFFGHKKGAFTGAEADQQGFLDVAANGTLFLDELGEIGPGLQVKLLRVIEGYGYSPVGGTELKIPNVRIIAATNKDLLGLVRRGLMREDFFYRIHILPIQLPPLRQRREDIPLLIDHFLENHHREGKPPHVPLNILQILETHRWPGNVRELQNTLYRYLTLGRIDFLDTSTPLHPPAAFSPPVATGSETSSLKTLMDTYEKKIIVAALERHQWHRTQVAENLGINRKTLFKKLRRHGIGNKKRPQNR